jgi:phage/conjugal plasmid C-4 type zinc finger TraR family protein
VILNYTHHKRRESSNNMVSRMCSSCGNEISEARRKAKPSATLCVPCQQVEESAPKPEPTYGYVKWNENGKLIEVETGRFVSRRLD